MKNTKRLLAALLCLAVFVVCMFAMASCKKEHEHSYTSKVTEPSCTEEGYTTYTCECGDSYVDNNVAATGHSYTEAVTKNPTATEKGEKTFTCSKCGDTYTEEINALALPLGIVTKTIAEAIGDGKWSVSMDEGFNLIYVKELNEEAYELGLTGTKGFFAINLAEVVLDITNGYPIGHIKFEAGIADAIIDGTTAVEDITVANFTDTASVYIYLEGDDVFVEYSENDEAETLEFNITEKVEEYIAGMFGIDVSEISKVYAAFAELAKYQSVIDQLMAELEEVELPAIDLSAELEALMGNLIVIEELDETHTSYSVNLSGICESIEALGDKTVAQLVDAKLGEGTTAALAEAVAALPTMTVKEIADAAIALAENYGVEVENTYILINYVLKTQGIEIDIAEAIETNGDTTLAELVALLKGAEDAAAAAEQLTTMVETVAGMLTTATIDEFYNAFAGAEDGFSIMENIAATVESLSGAVTAEVVVDTAADECVELNLTVYEVLEGEVTENQLFSFRYMSIEILQTSMKAVMLSVNGYNVNISYTENSNGTSSLTATVLQDDAELASLELGVTVSDDVVTAEGTVTIDGATAELAVTIDNSGLVASVTFEGETAVIYVTPGETGVTAGVTFEGMDILKIQLTVDENGQPTALSVEANSLYYVDNVAQVENVATVNVALGAEGLVFNAELNGVEIALTVTPAENGVTLDALIVVGEVTVLDGSLAVEVGEHSATLSVDVDTLDMGGYETSTDFVEGLEEYYYNVNESVSFEGSITVDVATEKTVSTKD